MPIESNKQGNTAGSNIAAGIKENLINLRKEVIRESLSEFENVPHRLELVANIHGIEYLNDSKATNVNSTWYSLERMEKKVVWIMGGVDKNTDYESLMPLVKEKVRAIIYLGDSKEKVFDSFLETIPMIVDAKTMKEAVDTAYYLADKSEVVLLSPASASFNMFDNYEERGEAFIRAVREL